MICILKLNYDDFDAIESWIIGEDVEEIIEKARDFGPALISELRNMEIKPGKYSLHGGYLMLVD